MTLDGRTINSLKHSDALVISSQTIIVLMKEEVTHIFKSCMNYLYLYHG